MEIDKTPFGSWIESLGRIRKVWKFWRIWLAGFFYDINENGEVFLELRLLED